MPVLATIFKFKMAVRYDVGSDGQQASYEPTYRFLPICVLSSSIYLELWPFSDFHSGHFFKFKMAAR